MNDTDTSSLPSRGIIFGLLWLLHIVRREVHLAIHAEKEKGSFALTQNFVSVCTTGVDRTWSGK
jgi:hypothetical protein